MIGGFTKRRRSMSHRRDWQGANQRLQCHWATDRFALKFGPSGSSLEMGMNALYL
jgi:hypothetical protein